MDVFDRLEELFEKFLEDFSSHPYRIYNRAPAAPTKEPQQEVQPMPYMPPQPPAIIYPAPKQEQKCELTLFQLQKIMPTLPVTKAQEYCPMITGAMHEFEIDNPKRVAAFLAQLAHESNQLFYMEEIASGDAYEGRKDLGNVLPGDGKRYKGRGPIQLTGRANYRDYGKTLGLDLENEPFLAAKPEVGFRVAACFWKRKGLNELADNGDFKLITAKINGGYNGLASRINYYTHAKEILGVT